MSTQKAQDVLGYWFGTRPYGAASVAHHARLWFGDPAAPELTPQTDELLRERFGELLLAARRGDLASWESGPRRRLALIVVLDQLSRNIYRGTPQAFAQDDYALRLTVSGMQVGADAALDPIERIFFYMPLMHAESLEVQEESVSAFRRLLEEAPAELHEHFDGCAKYAVLHRDIIARFGRFPHRNALLGRDNTPEEGLYLAHEAEDFGQ